MKITKLYKGKDQINNLDFDMVNVNALELSNYIKNSLEEKGINYKEHNTQGLGYRDEEKLFEEKLFEENDSEIYEYQNFFLLKDEKDYILLDGFRRLLWAIPPSVNINVRIYNREDITDVQLLELMVNLNHFKFISNIGTYYDRGFALFIRTLFNINILKFKHSFDGFLGKKDEQRNYSNYGNNTDRYVVKDRIKSDIFLKGIKFLQQLSDNDYMKCNFIGTTIFNYLNENPKANLDFDQFKKLHNDKKEISKLIISYRKNTNRIQEVTNKLIPLYKNILIEINGGETVKTLAEIQNDYKDKLKQLKKDKSLTLISRFKATKDINYHDIQNYIKSNKDVEFKCLVMPKTIDGDHDLYEGDKVYLGGVERHWQSKGRQIIKVKLNSGNLNNSVGHQYSNYGSTTTYDHIINNKCYLFINATVNEIIEYNSKNKIS